MDAVTIGGFKYTSRRPRGWFGVVFLFGALAATALSRPLVAEGTTADVITDALAWAVLAAGFLVRLWATLYIGGRKGKELATEGPYSLCRNPLYVGSMLVGVALALSLKSVAVLAGVAFAAAAYSLYLVPSEERKLEQRFGDAYRRYRDRTPRFLPRWRQFHTSPVVRVRVQGLAREMARSAWLPLLPLAGEIVAELRTMAGWPQLFSGL